MSSALLSPETLGQSLGQFDCIIDARSPAEYALDHIPGAINCPVLNNEERATVGTLYKQESPFAAKKLGAALVAKNIASHLQEHFIQKPREWRPLVYCWRGGERSGAFAHILQRIGWKAQQLQGGYQGYRRQVVADLERWAPHAKFTVICGMTGTGKTRLLQALNSHAQVLDLEGLAAHRGSVLGGLPNEVQPSQKMFESRLWNALRQFTFDQTIYVESESKKVGCLHIPDALMDQIRQGDCVEIKADRSVRVDVLMEEYVHLLSDHDGLRHLLSLLTQRYGKEQITKWQQLAAEGRYPVLVEELLIKHYDPAYQDSIARNFSQYQNARTLTVQDAQQASYLELAQQLLQSS
ncbi:MULTISPECIES: tRNA 2-selenouridine(34) synthase MnmH [unclassified Polynucleobacter]|uniref:tRNA 2-selenouridine(34) synthase MnmH n=1 Tax=unclassified Polynucleobacter TaxID=2640945 RepID=UPI00257382A1|nr:MULTISPECIES: tRNA 2-selenouridine(34) synthase MnmH [unclassified Polynucleobacter]BEI42766.1 tRNA 2-selenouridine(34) synthase MnmH [Polynucleobacter sp. HIN10]BEI44520.1 tRNA 2-selenouridine(34) synthase MnmH [Polynucleobacter sp. HIN11]